MTLNQISIEARDDIPSSFVKRINDKLSISITYLNESSQKVPKKDDHVDKSHPSNISDDNDHEYIEALISFHNTSDKTLAINDDSEAAVNDESETGKTQPESSWFSSIWSNNNFDKEEKEKLQTESQDTDEISVLLGYVQLFGYLTLNYKFDLSSLAMDTSNKNSWWKNKDYYNYYQNMNENEDEEDIKDSKIEKTLFLQENYLKNRLIIGGKLGGINDLALSSNSNESGGNVVGDYNRFLIQDLLYTFNTLEHKSKKPTANQEDESSHDKQNNDGGLPLKDVTDAIIPFYSTSQYLLFTNLKLKPKSTETYHIKFQTLDSNLPPSYNTNSTGIVGDQGWSSIKYLLIIGILEPKGNHILPRSIYFPFNNKGKQIGNNERWLQSNYLDSTKVEKNWQVSVIKDNDEDKESIKLNKLTILEYSMESFLHDLDKLISSDLQSVSKNERRKSSTLSKISEFREKIKDTEANKDIADVVPQLPSHLKTQYQIRVNNYNLCDISISKPYYHIGEDINYSININPDGIETTKIAGIITHLEAHEIYHLNNDEKTDYTNIYRVSQPIKTNTFASSLINSYSKDEQHSSLVNELIHIPNHISQQFQSSKFMDLKYFLVFKFNLNEFDKHLKNSESNTTESTDVAPPGFDNEYKFDNNHASEFRFRLPLVLLP